MNRITQSPIVTSILSRVGLATCTIHWRGRKSGNQFSTDVWYRGTPNGIRIRVARAQKKTWWRNFWQHEWPIAVTIAGIKREGIGLAEGDPHGKLYVNVIWTDPS